MTVVLSSCTTEVLNETIVLIKSAATFTKKKLHFIIFTDTIKVALSQHQQVISV